MKGIAVTGATSAADACFFGNAATLLRVVRSLPLPALLVDRCGIVGYANDEAAALLPGAVPGSRVDLSALADSGPAAPEFRLFRVPASTVSGVRAECVVILRPPSLQTSRWLLH